MQKWDSNYNRKKKMNIKLILGRDWMNYGQLGPGQLWPGKPQTKTTRPYILRTTRPK